MMKIYDSSFVCSECKRKVQEYSNKNRERTIKSWVVICNRCMKDIEKKHQNEIENTINFYEKWITEEIAKLKEQERS